jgi:cytochrome c-type biogenesis protein CcmE
MQKLLLPLLVIAVIAVMYFFYFKQKDVLGNFSDFDTNNNANKDIRVEWVREKGIDESPSAGTAMFFAKDSKGMEYPVQVPLPLPENFSELESLHLRGHLHKDHFHAIEILE